VTAVGIQLSAISNQRHVFYCSPLTAHGLLFMVMLSSFERFKLADAHGRHASLADFAIALHSGDYPCVTKLIYQTGWRRKLILAWEAVKRIDWNARHIIIENIHMGAEITDEQLDEETLLVRDVRDSMVLDLQNRRAARVNDLWLEETDKQIYLRGADMSMRAIWRRVTGGRRAPPRKEDIYDWKYVEFLSGNPRGTKRDKGFNLRIERLPPGEIALLSAALPYLHAAELLMLLPDELAADVLEFMRPERQLQVFEELSHERALRLLALMRPDAATSLLGRLHPDAARKFLRQLPEEQSGRLIELLRYPENTVGSIMTNDFAFVRADLTVEEAREELRERLKKPDFAYLVYVVEDEETRKLCGVISLRQLIIADEDQTIRDIMDEYVSTLQPLEPAQPAAYRVLSAHLAAMPVVGRERSLIGVVTIDAAFARTNSAGWGGQTTPRVFA
jgi:magnesium transporter